MMKHGKWADSQIQFKELYKKINKKKHLSL